MQRGFAQSSGSKKDPPPRAPCTRALMIALFVISLIGSLGERRFGVGTSLLDFRVDRVLDGELWRLITYPFVESQPFGLILSAVVLWFFGRWFEQLWGRRDFLRFFAASAVGAAVLALGLSFLFNLILPFRDIGAGEGPGPVFNAMLVAMVISSPNATVLFGFVIPVRARTLVYVLLGIQLIFGIQTGAAALSIHVGGMIMGYLLATGKWRPSRILQVKQRRRDLYVVPPRNYKLN